MHSNCPRHALQARTMNRCPWPRFRARVTLSWFYVESSIIHVESSIKVYLYEAVIAVGVKPSIIIVLDMHFKQALWPDTLDLDFVLEWLWHDFTFSLALFMTSSILWSGDSYEYQTLHGNCPQHTIQARTMTRWHWPTFHDPLTLS